MTRRGERLTRVALRLGLLLGGVVAVWGAHEIATAGAAYAADRPALVHYAPHVVTGTHGQLSGWEPTTAPAHHRPPTDGRASAPPRRWTPDRSPTQASDTPPAPHRTAYRPARQRPADRFPAPSGPGPTTTTGDRLRPTTRPARAVPTPGRVTDAAPSAARRPGNDPVLKPPMSPKSPESPPPVKTAKPAKPATDVVAPHTDPPRARRARSAPSGDPGGPMSALRPVTVTTANRAAGDQRAHVVPTPARWSAATGGPAASRPALPPGPFSPDVTPVPGTNAPGTTGAGSTAGHGELADAAPEWVPPAQSGRLCRDASDDAHPSRSPRPGTRPA